MTIDEARRLIEEADEPSQGVADRRAAAARRRAAGLQRRSIPEPVDPRALGAVVRPLVWW